jgi:hypothetical protein
MYLFRWIFGLLTAGAAGLAFTFWGPYYAFAIPSTAQAVTQLQTVAACNTAYAGVLQTTLIPRGDKHLQAVGLARLQIACANRPNYVQFGEQSAGPDVGELARQANIRDEAMQQLSASQQSSLWR